MPCSFQLQAMSYSSLLHLLIHLISFSCHQLSVLPKTVDTYYVLNESISSYEALINNFNFQSLLKLFSPHTGFRVYKVPLQGTQPQYLFILEQNMLCVYYTCGLFAKHSRKIGEYFQKQLIIEQYNMSANHASYIICSKCKH